MLFQYDFIIFKYILCFFLYILICYAFIHLLSKDLELDNDSSSEEEVAEKNIAQVPINAAFNYQ